MAGTIHVPAPDPRKGGHYIWAVPGAKIGVARSIHVPTPDPRKGGHYIWIVPNMKCSGPPCGGQDNSLFVFFQVEREKLRSIYVPEKDAIAPDPREGGHYIWAVPHMKCSGPPRGGQDNSQTLRSQGRRRDCTQARNLRGPG